MNDKEIIAAILEGDGKAFEMIYDRFHTHVFLLAKRYVHSEEDAKDIRSNCFIKLWELRSTLSFDNMAALYGWLRSIATHSCIDYLRKTSTRKEKKEEVIYEYLSAENVDAFEVEDKEALILDRLLKQIEQLPPNVKQVFKMRWLRELKYTEIAQELGADVSTIKKRYARAITLLKKSIRATCLIP